jgi:hypothetical protein
VLISRRFARFLNGEGIEAQATKVEASVLKDQLFPAMSITMYAIPGR